MVPKLVYVLLGLALAGLLLENVPAIRATNTPHLDQYARLAAGSLPTEGAFVLSDDPARLAVLQAELAREGKAERYVPVETRTLPFAPYRAWLSRKYPERWPKPQTEASLAGVGDAASKTDTPLDDFGVLQLVFRLAQSNHVYCLQPSVGRLLEAFYLQPHGLLHEMKLYPMELLDAPPLTAAELAENQTFWQDAIETSVKPILRLVSQSELPRSAFEKRLMKLGHLQTPPPAQARVLALVVLRRVEPLGRYAPAKRPVERGHSLLHAGPGIEPRQPPGPRQLAVQQQSAGAPENDGRPDRIDFAGPVRRHREC